MYPIVHFWLHHTVHGLCQQKVGQGEVGVVTHRVLCTWQLLGLAVEVPWLALGGPILTLAALAGLESTTLTF